MTVDILQNSVAAPQESVFFTESLFSGTPAGDYEVLRVVSSHMTTATLRVQKRTTGELAELRFVFNPSFSIATMTSTPPVSTETVSTDTAVGCDSTTTSAQDGEEAMRLWRQKVTTWTEALRPLLEMGSHPHIQRLLDFGEAEAGFYLLLENVEGRALREVLESEGARTLEWMLPLCVQLASALDFAAAQNLCHGDLTPDNILLSNALPEDAANRPGGALLGRCKSESSVAIKLRNFGLSFMQPRSVSAYTSPEQVAGQKGDARSDIYAFGAVLYTSLSGRPPFTAASRNELCQKIRNASPLPLAGQPVWVCDIIDRAKKRTPADRYQVAVDIVTDLTFRRSPAQVELDTHHNDCSLGHFMPALALQEEGAETPANKPSDKTEDKTRKEKNSLAKFREAIPIAPLMAALRNPVAFLRRSPVDPNAQMDADAEGLPVYGLLGYFNRRMALQEYVFLDENAVEWRGWRGRLRCIGIRVPVRPPRKPSAASLWMHDFKLPLPDWLRKRLKLLKRMAAAGVFLTLLAAFLHTAWRVQEYDRARVFRMTGSPEIQYAGSQPVYLQQNAVLEAAAPYTISTQENQSLMLDLADAQVELGPDATSLEVTQANYYDGTRQLSLALRGNGGEVTEDIAPQAAGNAPGRYDLWVGKNNESENILVQAQSTETPTTLAVLVNAKGVLVSLARGNATVRVHGRKQQLFAGKQLRIPPGQMPPKLTDLPAEEGQKMLAKIGNRSEKRGMLTALLSGFAAEADQRMLPLVDQGRNLLKLKFGGQSEVDKATACMSLNAIHDALQENTELPAYVEPHLRGIGLDENTRNRWLNAFAGHKLEGCYLENGSYVMLAYVNNKSHPMLKWQGGEIKVIPEEQADEEKRKANEKQGQESNL